jgi:hypothetical protein
MPSDTDPSMVDLRRMSKPALIELAARQRIQVGVLEAVRDDLQVALRESEGEREHLTRAYNTVVGRTAVTQGGEQ